MSKPPPSDDELWTSAGPLQPPSDAAAARAKPIFERWLNEVRDNAPRTPIAAASPVAIEAPGWHVGGGRRYDLALTVALGPQQARSYVEAAARPEQPVAPPKVPARTSAPPPVRPSALSAVRAPVRPTKQGLLPLDEDPTTLSQDSTLEPTVIYEMPDDATHTAIRPPPTRPPPGVATVRPPLKTGQKTADVDPAVWQQTADTALLRTQADGGMAFDIVIRDDVFADLSCTIAVNEGRATATFRVRDTNMRRLLEAEVGRLRTALEGRGLRVDRVDVMVNEDP